MAYANHPNQQFFDFPAVNSSPPAFVSGPPPLGVINPIFAPVVPRLVPANPHVIVPVGFALNTALLVRMEGERSLSLLQFMAGEGVLPSPEEEFKRKIVIDKLKQIVMEWIKRVAYQHQLPTSYMEASSATILTYGSYGLGVHNSDSDIDALCVGPWFASMAEDFFIVLRNMLSSRPEVSDIHCVKDAKVPLMRLKFDGISIDLPYAQLKVLSIPASVDILNPFFLRDIDETSWKSLSGVRANKSILQLVTNVKMFQSLLRCIKLWAQRRGVYGNLFGFFGGVHYAILAAYVCQRHPNAGLSSLVSIFFKTFSTWPWPIPVVLQHGLSPSAIPFETRSLMPIQLPCSPYEYCHSNVTRSTSNRIKSEFLRGYNLTKDLLRPDFDWCVLFQPFSYARRYERFVKICISASDQDCLGDWVGWVKSRFRSLLLKLEEVQGFCDPNPAEYVDADVTKPNVAFYWGLQPGRYDLIDIATVEEDFMKNTGNGYQGTPGKVALSVMQACELPQKDQFSTGSGNITKSCERIQDCHWQQIPVYSKHLPHYQVGYLLPNGNVGFC